MRREVTGKWMVCASENRGRTSSHPSSSHEVDRLHLIAGKVN